MHKRLDGEIIRVVKICLQIYKHTLKYIVHFIIQGSLDID